MYSQSILKICPELGRHCPHSPFSKAQSSVQSCPTFRCSSCASWLRGASPPVRSAGTKDVRAGLAPASEHCKRLTGPRLHRGPTEQQRHLGHKEAPHPYTTKYKLLRSTPCKKEQQYTTKYLTNQKHNFPSPPPNQAYRKQVLIQIMLCVLFSGRKYY